MFRATITGLQVPAWKGSRERFGQFARFPHSLPRKSADRRREIEYTLSGIDEAPVLFHPSMSLQYQAEIGRLIETLNSEKSRSEASELMRSLINKIVLTPNSAGTELTIDLFRDLVGVLAMARKGEKPLDTSDIETMGLKLVAEEGLEPPTRGL